MRGVKRPDPGRTAAPGPPLTSLFSSAPDLTGPDATTDPVRLLAQAEWQLYIDSRRAGELGQAALDATRDRPTLALRGDAWYHVGVSLLRAGAPKPRSRPTNSRGRRSPRTTTHAAC